MFLTYDITLYDHDYVPLHCSKEKEKEKRKSNQEK